MRDLVRRLQGKQIEFEKEAKIAHKTIKAPGKLVNIFNY